MRRPGGWSDWHSAFGVRWEDCVALPPTRRLSVFPNVPECTCDRDDDEDEAPRVFCDYHEARLRHLRWDTLACIVIDYEAVLHANADRLVPTRQCDACGDWYLFGDKRKARFCSDRCRYREGKRRQRARQKAEGQVSAPGPA